MGTRLTMKDRRQIAQMYSAEMSVMRIAAEIGCHAATVYDELRRGATGELDENMRPKYDPERGQEVYQANMRRGVEARAATRGRSE